MLRFLSLILTFALFNSPSFSQVAKRLQRAYDIFDYSEFEKEYNRKDAHTPQEQILWASVSYKIGNYDQTIATLADLEKVRALTPYEQSLRDDSKRIQNSLKSEVLFTVSPLSNNTKSSEFTAYLDNDSLYYASDKMARVSYRERDVRKKQPFINVYKTTVLEDSSLVDNRIKPTFTKLNEGPLCPWKNGWLITRNFTSAKGVNNLRLVFVDKNFKDVSEFPYNKVTHSLGHATADKNFNFIIFSSDMPLGNGVTDLFISYFDQNTNSFKEPKRLTQNINSAGNEMFPYLIENELYFSSNGHNGYGNLDVYQINLNDSISSPTLLPFPINTASDDFGLISKDGFKGYFTSNREAGKEDDIYYFDRSQITFGCKKECTNDPCVLLEIENFETFPPDQFDFTWMLGNGDSLKGPFANYCYPSLGDFTVQLNVFDKRSKIKSLNVATGYVNVKNLIKNNPSFSLPQETSLGLSTKFNNTDRLTSGTIASSHWEFGDGKTSNLENVEHVYDQIGFYKIIRNVKVNLPDGSCCFQKSNAYTYVKDPNARNNSGDSGDLTAGNNGKYNPRLRFVDEQGNSVSGVNYRIVSKMGTEPITGISTRDSIKLALDRAIDYSLTATSDQGVIDPTTLSTSLKTEANFSYYEVLVRKPKAQPYILKIVDTKGNLVSNVQLRNLKDSTILLAENGIINFNDKPSSNFSFSKKFYFPAVADGSKWTNRDTNIVILIKIEADAVFRLDNIYFDLGKYNIRPDAALELNKVLEIMQEYPTLEIELQAHTDARGSAQSNFTLSDNRAKSAAAYIVSQGINISRITGQGYGETKLLNKCKDGVKCTEKEHQFNRRVEIKIKKI